MKKIKGFTLIELMVVMAIIAILATAGLSAYTGYIKKARDTTRLSIANQVEIAVNALMGSNRGIPPNSVELIAYLGTLNMTAVIDTLEVGGTLYLSMLSKGLRNATGIPMLYANIKEPSGGKSVCLGYDSEGDVRGGQSCAFRYIVYGDDTYVIGYGVEHESSMKKNFYKIVTAVDGGAPKYMQVVGTAAYVGIPSIGETGGPAKTATAFGASKVIIGEDGGVLDADISSEINTEKSGPLSTETGGSGGGEVDACNNACTVGQVCGEEDTCVDLCGGTECVGGQVCGEEDTCVDPDPCAGKSIGQACNGTTAVYAGTYGGYSYMTTPSDLGSYTWGPLGVTGITGTTDGAANTNALLALAGTYPAAAGCRNVGLGFDDWFLPAHAEIVGVLVANNALIGGFTSGGYYWSSTDAHMEYAMIVQFPNNYPPNQWGYKPYSRPVRCVRKY